MNKKTKKRTYESPVSSEMVVILEQTIAVSGDVTVPNGDVTAEDYENGEEITGTGTGGNYEIKW